MYYIYEMRMIWKTFDIYEWDNQIRDRWNQFVVAPNFDLEKIQILRNKNVKYKILNVIQFYRRIDLLVMELYSEATDSESDAVPDEVDVGVTETNLFGRIDLLIHKLDQVISSTQEISQNLTRINLNPDTENNKGKIIFRSVWTWIKTGLILVNTDVDDHNW